MSCKVATVYILLFLVPGKRRNTAAHPAHRPADPPDAPPTRPTQLTGHHNFETGPPFLHASTVSGYAGPFTGAPRALSWSCFVV